MKLSQDAQTAVTYRDVHKVDLVKLADRVLTDRPGEIGDGGNSGFQALNIIAQFAPRRIVLTGIDMRLDHGLHWHGAHGGGLSNPNDARLPRWRRAFNNAAPVLAGLGIEVVNASPVSTLTAYPIVEFEEAVA